MPAFKLLGLPLADDLGCWYIPLNMGSLPKTKGSWTHFARVMETAAMSKNLGSLEVRPRWVGLVTNHTPKGSRAHLRSVP